MRTTAVVVSLAICAVSAALEAVAAGPRVKRRFAELRLPRYWPPLPVWIAIGLLYYVVCFIVSYRLLGNSPQSSLRDVAFGLLLVLMGVNAFWNYLFFRRKDVRASFVAFLPYGLVALALYGVLRGADPVAAWVVLPYLVYLAVATWAVYRLWRLNEDASRVKG